jgi:inosose dehydratase
MPANVRVGSAPDSWGVWFPDDARQIAWPRFLDEVAQAGYEWIELGPLGYLPVDSRVLRMELEARGLKLAGGFIMRHLESDAEWKAIEADLDAVGGILADCGASHLLLIDNLYREVDTGAGERPRSLGPDDWSRFVDVTHRVAELARARFGLQLAFHPHAETHVEYEPQIERFLNETDPGLVSLCLDTGHHAYRGGDPVAFFRRHHGRVSYLHLKNVDAEVIREVVATDMPFARAVQEGAFCEPSRGVVDFHALRDALQEVGYDGWAISEQDMYPAPPDKPLPIARRTRAFLRDIGIG